jgi:hypothetical protein
MVRASADCWKKVWQLMDHEHFRLLALDFPSFGLRDRPAKFSYCLEGLLKSCWRRLIVWAYPPLIWWIIRWEEALRFKWL